MENSVYNVNLNSKPQVLNSAEKSELTAARVMQRLTTYTRGKKKFKHKHGGGDHHRNETWVARTEGRICNIRARPGRSFSVVRAEQMFQQASRAEAHLIGGQKDVESQAESCQGLRDTCSRLPGSKFFKDTCEILRFFLAVRRSWSLARDLSRESAA